MGLKPTYSVKLGGEEERSLGFRWFITIAFHSPVAALIVFAHLSTQNLPVPLTDAGVDLNKYFSRPL